MATEKVFSEEEILDLVHRAQEGSTEAFGTIYEEYFAPVYRYAIFRLPEELAEDAVADIFVKAWEKLHRFKPRRNVPFGAWLFRIARYTIIDIYRTQRGFEEISEDIEDPDALSRADTGLRQQETVRMVRSAMDRLPRRYREILVLSFIADLPNSAISRVLRMTEGGVRILKFRALKRLEKLLPPEAGHS